MSARRSSHDGGGRPARQQKPAAPTVVIPFPSQHRVAFIQRQAAAMAAYKPDAAQRYLAHRLFAHREALERKGVALEVIDADCRALESAINAALWRIILMGGAR